MVVRKLNETEIPAALNLAWEVFQIFVAPEYPEEGIKEFHSYVMEGWKKNDMSFYGSFEKEEMMGMAALRPVRHISLFFVKETFQGIGVGRAIFEFIKKDLEGRVMTVNSSPYAVEIYHHLGFRQMADEMMTDGIRYIPMRFGDCPCPKSGTCPRSINCIECRNHHSDSDKPRPCDKVND